MNPSLVVVEKLHYPNNPDIAVVTLERGRTCLVNNLIVDEAVRQGLVSVSEIDDRGRRLICAKKDLIMTVYGIKNTRDGCTHIMFVRENKHYRQSELSFASPSTLPERLQAKLTQAMFGNKDKRITHIQVLLDLSTVVLVKGETLLPNWQSHNKVTAWIMPEEVLTQQLGIIDQVA